MRRLKTNGMYTICYTSSEVIRVHKLVYVYAVFYFCSYLAKPHLHCTLHTGI